MPEDHAVLAVGVALALLDRVGLHLGPRLAGIVGTAGAGRGSAVLGDGEEPLAARSDPILVLAVGGPDVLGDGQLVLLRVRSNPVSGYEIAGFDRQCTVIPIDANGPDIATQ